MARSLPWLLPYTETKVLVPKDIKSRLSCSFFRFRRHVLLLAGSVRVGVWLVDLCDAWAGMSDASACCYGSWLLFVLRGLVGILLLGDIPALVRLSDIPALA